MCRITGFQDFNYKGQHNMEKTILSMRDTMVYGGPDDGGYYMEKERGLAAAFRIQSL